MTRDDHPGTYNVGAPDIVSLTQALRLMGRPTVGVPLQLAPLIAGMLRQARLGDWSSDQIAALTYGRAMDTTRFVNGHRAEAALHQPRRRWRSSSGCPAPVC